MTLYGKNLDSGSHVEVKLSSGTMTSTDCIIDSRHSGALVCLTAPTTIPFDADLLTVSIDDAVLPVVNASFRYMADPVVSLVAPEKGTFRSVIRAQFNHINITLFVRSADLTFLVIDMLTILSSVV